MPSQADGRQSKLNGQLAGARFVPLGGSAERSQKLTRKVLVSRRLAGRKGTAGGLGRAGDVVIRQHGFRPVLQTQARSAHQRTSSVVPSASSRWIAPEWSATPNARTAQATKETTATARRSVGDIERAPLAVG
jgi:hypothetical protein